MADDSRTEQIRSSHTPWNKGKLTGRKQPLKLRGCDLIALPLRDVPHGGTVAAHQGAADLSADEEPTGGTAAAEPPQAGKYGPPPRR